MPRFLAIDWDQNQLHVVAGVARGGKVQFQRALVWQEEKSPNPTDAEALGKVLRERLKSAGIAPAPVLACLPRDRVILKELRFPAVPVGDEAGVVRFQAVKELTDSPDDVVIDYVGTNTAGASEQQVLALIVRREILNTYQTICNAAGLKLAALTPRPFGVVACLKKATGGAAPTANPDGAVAVVVVGERWGEFCVLRGETPVLARSLTVGPGLAGEVRRNLMVYAGQSGRPPVTALYVAGAGSELRERLGEMIEVPIHELDPFGGAVGLDVPAGSRGAFAGAAGLLLARPEARGLPINFVHPRQPKPPASPKNRRIVLAAVALLLVLIGAAVGGWFYIHSRLHTLDAVQAQRNDMELHLVKERTDDKLIKALDEWDNVPWLDEIYDLTDRIPDVNALRITQVTAEPTTRTAKVKYMARITLKGTCAGAEGRKVLDQVIDGFRTDGYYSAEAPKMVGQQFTLVVNVERRPPSDYKRALKSTPDGADKNRNNDAGFGDFLP